MDPCANMEEKNSNRPYHCAGDGFEQIHAQSHAPDVDDPRGALEGRLLQMAASSDGPVVRLLNQNVNIEAAGKLRLCAQTLELEGGRGGVDIRTEADTVVRSRFVRLN